MRHRAIGASLSALADRLDAIGRGWEQRLERLAQRAEADQAQTGREQAPLAPDGG